MWPFGGEEVKRWLVLPHKFATGLYGQRKYSDGEHDIHINMENKMCEWDRTTSGCAGHILVGLLRCNVLHRTRTSATLRHNISRYKWKLTSVRCVSIAVAGMSKALLNATSIARTGDNLLSIFVRGDCVMVARGECPIFVRIN